MSFALFGKISFVPLTEESGAGYIAGVSPGVVTVNDVPSARAVEARDRVKRRVVATTMSNADGTYILHDLDPAKAFDVIARDWSGTYEDVIVGGVTPSTLPLIANAPPQAIIGQPYSFGYAIGYGSAPLSVALAGTLPSGLTASGNVISGSHPTGTPGTYSVTVTVTDADARVVTRTDQLLLVLLPLSVVGNHPDAALGSSASFQYVAAGGEGPYTFAITAGALPAGRSMSSAGLVTGTYTTTESASWTVGVTDVRSATASVGDSAVVADLARPHWRVYITAGNGPTYVRMIECEFRATIGGASLCVGGTASASSAFSGQPASGASDGIISDVPGERWTSSGAALPQWWAYALSSASEVNELAIVGDAASPTPDQSINAFKVQSSVDGSTWVDEWSVTGQTGWGSTFRTFARP